MNNLSEVAYGIDPVLWVRKVLGVAPLNWQEEFLRAPRGASILALTSRQAGKTTTAAWAIAHAAQREYLGIPTGAQASPFTWDLYECATQVR